MNVTYCECGKSSFLIWNTKSHKFHHTHTDTDISIFANCKITVDPAHKRNPGDNAKTPNANTYIVCSTKEMCFRWRESARFSIETNMKMWNNVICLLSEWVWAFVCCHTTYTRTHTHRWTRSDDFSWIVALAIAHLMTMRFDDNDDDDNNAPLPFEIEFSTPPSNHNGNQMRSAFQPNDSIMANAEKFHHMSFAFWLLITRTYISKQCVC